MRGDKYKKRKIKAVNKDINREQDLIKTAQGKKGNRQKSAKGQEKRTDARK